ncbi:ABC transporter substrate-binding protein, partial [Nanoarchaeota archaeon]
GEARILIQSPISTYFRQDLIFETSVMSTDFLQKNPDTAKKIIRATDKAIEFIYNNPKLARTYYSKFTPVDKEIQSQLPLGQYIPSYNMNPVEFQKTIDLFWTSNLISKPVAVTDILI